MSDDKKLESRSIGKLYAGERAIISMTSWRARINTCSKTIFSLLQQCPGFHIVLVLSEEEFPLMEKELPENLMLFVENELIEILWIYPNWKSFKKVLPTMDKYRDVPVISADDDCIYTCNYAQELYDKWKNDKNEKPIIYTIDLCRKFNTSFSHGPTTLFSPYCFLQYGITNLSPIILRTNHDDLFYGCLAKKYKISIKNIHSKCVYIFHDCLRALSQNNKISLSDAFKIIWKKI